MQHKLNTYPADYMGSRTHISLSECIYLNVISMLCNLISEFDEIHFVITSGETHSCFYYVS